jgi:hypothetical protein
VPILDVPGSKIQGRFTLGKVEKLMRNKRKSGFSETDIQKNILKGRKG